MHYVYDESGAPIGLNYRTNQYAANVFDVFYFEKNLQGDIVAVYNDSGARLGTYTYDAWGNFTISTASGITTLERSIVTTYNPFRYRGYYYDVDMGMYYLQSRYYNPQWGRFLNADGYVSTGQGLLGYNMFAYCNNNPVMNVDPSGEFLISAIVLKALAITTVCVAVAATVNDVYQIASGNVTVEAKDIDDDGIDDEVEVQNSYKITTPWVQTRYSAYINHINSDTRDIVKGTSFGFQYEWALHNIAYYTSLESPEQAGNLNAGASIFSDSHGGFMSNGMKVSYMMLYSPLIWGVDMIANGGYDK